MIKVSTARHAVNLAVHFLLAMAATVVTVAAVSYLINIERSQREEIAAALRVVDDRLKSMEQLMTDRTADRWTKNNMTDWASQLKASNPALTVPPVSDHQ